MVAFISSPIDTLLQGATRARAPGRTCTAVPMLPCKPNSRCDLRETNLTPDTRWGSRSRDPIGYVGPRRWSLFEFVGGMPTRFIDPSGFLEYDPTQSRPRTPQQLGTWLYQRLSQTCNACNYCNRPLGLCDESYCYREASNIASAHVNTFQRNLNPNPLSHFPWGPDNTSWLWPFVLANNERYRGYFCWSWARSLNAAVSGMDFCFSTEIEAAINTENGRMHFWIKIKSRCNGEESYVDDGFWIGRYFGHTEHPCSAEHGYPYSGPTYPDPRDYPGPDPVPQPPGEYPIPNNPIEIPDVNFPY